MKVILVHGWKGYPKGHWLEWLKEELERKNVNVHFPNLPNSDNPKQNEWIDELKKFKPFNENTVIVGHSLGATAILRLLENLEENEKIGKAILVACNSENTPVIQRVSDFFRKDFDWKLIKKKCKKFIVIHSNNDPYYTPESGKRLAEKLGAKFILKPNAGHISFENGYGPYPKLLKMILEK